MPRLDWRAWIDRVAHLWRGSLQLRTVVITVVLSTIAVTVIGGFISTSVQANLFDSRRDQVVSEAARATVNAQTEFTSSAEAAERQDLDVVRASVQDVIQRTSPGASQLAILRASDQEGVGAMQDAYSQGFVPETMITPELDAQLLRADGAQVYSQPVGIPRTDGSTSPGIIVGSVLDVPTAGRYQLFLVFSLADVQATLDFVQQTLAVGGLALVALIGLVAFVVVRLVVGPVRIAAETSEKLAAGMLEERLPEKGEDVLATLARSFNRMADSLQSQIRQLADLSRVQQRFVSDVSHELRTPLTTIRLAGDVLYDQRDDFSPTTARTAELLHTQTERFELLLADLLEMSRYDAGAVELEIEPTNLVRLVEDALEAVAPLAEERESELRLVAPGGYFEAEVDARRVRRVLQNLLGNAIDHGEGRPIVVWVDSDADAVAIAVRDYGVGMSPTQAERVFDRFWRADPSRQRRTGGTGLGLAIALEDAAVHGGTLDVWSEEGEGSCFRLTLPRRGGGVLVTSPLALPPDDGPEFVTEGDS
ncbi:MAG: MtrAB system histidine kinase MtrB [Microbacteriaceae bacterium]